MNAGVLFPIPSLVLDASQNSAELFSVRVFELLINGIDPIVRVGRERLPLTCRPLVVRVLALRELTVVVARVV
jgi:hypothetical protein